LGKALALALAKQKIPLILTGRNRAALEVVKRQVDVESTLLICDLADREERQKLLALIREKTPDLIINNAGVGLYGDALSHPTQDALEILEVNCHALVEITLEAARTLTAKNKKGTILNISSAAAYFTYPKFCLYAASKGFVKQFSESFDAEVKDRGIRVLTSCPGQIRTDFRRRASRGTSRKEGRLSMPLEKAVQEILHQLKTQKSVHIFDGRYRAMILLSRLMPKSLVQALLKREISSRIES
jgi:short-subunit dehydrogenase